MVYYGYLFNLEEDRYHRFLESVLSRINRPWQRNNEKVPEFSAPTTIEVRVADCLVKAVHMIYQISYVTDHLLLAGYFCPILSKHMTLNNSPQQDNIESANKLQSN